MKNINLLRIIVFTILFLISGTFSYYVQYKEINITPKIIFFSLIGGILDSVIQYLLKKKDK